MFARNILTFNPGWSASAEGLEQFKDVRELERDLKANGIAAKKATEEGASGPASFMIEDPDGNEILIDQHV